MHGHRWAGHGEARLGLGFVKRLATLAALALAAYLAHSAYWAWMEDNRQGR